MKIAVIGGAGVRTPLLVHSLANSELPVGDLTLYDTDQDRLEVIACLAGQLSGPIDVRSCATCEECVEGADFVFTSIRVGGIGTRARDEAVALRHGIVGQETVGPGGFAMAIRTIPHMIRYAGEIQRRAPRAWIINFTNPVGIVTEAVSAETGARIVGICDTPTELFFEAARALDIPADQCRFDYFGLNHLGWLREIYYRGEPQFARLWAHPDLLSRVYRAPLFEHAFLQELRLLPTEYLYYYYRPDTAAEHLRRAGTTRGSVIARLNENLLASLRTPGADGVAIYREYLSARNASYMQLESGVGGTNPAADWAAPTGYDRIALSVVRAIHLNLGSIIPLNVQNCGNLPFLERDDIVEIPCVVNCNGPLPLHVGPVPEAAVSLMVRVKQYERLTVRAGVTGDRELLCRALAGNPLVPATADVSALISDLELP
jgi:6-phospho-beta-glucosidase